MSRPCERYCEPLRLPGQPAATSGAALIRRGGTPGVRWAGSPVVPGATVRACHPCYPGGSGRAGQLYGLVRHRPSPTVHRVGTLAFVTRLRLGSLRATACAVARPLGGRSSGNLVLWVTPHTSLKLPGRTANSQGRTSTGKCHSIHGMRTLRDTSHKFSACRRAIHGALRWDSARRRRHQYPSITMTAPGQDEIPCATAEMSGSPSGLARRRG